MKRRFIAAGLAAATALSFSVAPAQAQNNMTSSYNDFFGQKAPRLSGWVKLGIGAISPR